MYKILTYNNISISGLERFPREHYEIASEFLHPDAILLRSFKLHGHPVPETLKAVGRAGVGVNNIPLQEYTRRGIPVFNSPGANANAVKELVIAGMFLAARNVCRAWQFVRQLEADDETLGQQVEQGKKRFVGFELAGKTLGIIGLGAIGVKVANAAHGLGMNVVGFDPHISIENAWKLSSSVLQASHVDEVLERSDFVSLHVPLTEATRKLIDEDRLGLLRETAVLVNFARDDLVDEAALSQALESGRLHAYVTDFPGNALKNHERVVALPHLGASTREAEEYCAIMVADQVRDFLENGNVRHSVNFPEVVMPRTEGFRVCVANSNVPNMVSQISASLGEAGLNILDLLNKSRAEVAYTVLDVDRTVPLDALDRIRAIDGVLAVRVVQ